jgi:hypothetical protein
VGWAYEAEKLGGTKAGVRIAPLRESDADDEVAAVLGRTSLAAAEALAAQPTRSRGTLGGAGGGGGARGGGGGDYPQAGGGGAWQQHAPGPPPQAQPQAPAEAPKSAGAAKPPAGRNSYSFLVPQAPAMAGESTGDEATRRAALEAKYAAQKKDAEHLYGDRACASLPTAKMRRGCLNPIVDCVAPGQARGARRARRARARARACAPPAPPRLLATVFFVGPWRPQTLAAAFSRAPPPRAARRAP